MTCKQYQTLTWQSRQKELAHAHLLLEESLSFIALQKKQEIAIKKALKIIFSKKSRICKIKGLGGKNISKNKFYIFRTSFSQKQMWLV